MPRATPTRGDGRTYGRGPGRTGTRPTGHRTWSGPRHPAVRAAGRTAVRAAVRAAGRTAAGLAGAALVAVVVVAPAAPASAHTRLESSTPKDKARISEPPAAVELIFTDQLRGRYTQVAVLGPGEKNYESGPPRSVGERVTQAVRPLGPAGEYTVAYRVVAPDGHPITGKVSFTLTRPGPQASAAPGGSAGSAGGPADAGGSRTGASDRAGGAGGLGWSVVIGVAAVALLLAGALAISRYITRDTDGAE